MHMAKPEAAPQAWRAGEVNRQDACLSSQCPKFQIFVTENIQLARMIFANI
jgi:hypothetical protein